MIKQNKMKNLSKLQMIVENKQTNKQTGKLPIPVIANKVLGHVVIHSNSVNFGDNSSVPTWIDANR